MKKTHILGLVLVAVAMGIIMVALGDSSKYVNFEKAQAYPDEEYHVVGKLVEEKPMIYEPRKNPNKFTFYLEDKQGTVKKVVYNDGKPRDIERSDKIVIMGSMKDDKTFKANNILMKCPSKYKKEGVMSNTKEAMNK